MTVSAHTRITFSGILGSTTAPLETWAFNINTDLDTAPLTKSVLQQMAGAAKAAYAANLAPIMPSDVILTNTRVAQVAALGRVQVDDLGSYAQADDTSTSVGSGAPKALPASTAVVVSLVTGRSGPSGKGRFFLPMTQYAPDATDKLYTAIAAQNIAGAAQTFIQALNTALTGHDLGTVCVVSTKGFLTPVTGVKVGRRPDVLRSRSRQQREMYQPTLTITP